MAWGATGVGAAATAAAVWAGEEAWNATEA